MIYYSLLDYIPPKIVHHLIMEYDLIEEHGKIEVGDTAFYSDFVATKGDKTYYIFVMSGDAPQSLLENINAACKKHDSGESFGIKVYCTSNGAVPRGSLPDGCLDFRFCE